MIALALRWVLRVAAFVASLAAVGWLAGTTQMLELWLGLWAVFWLAVTRTQPRSRHLHVTLLLASVFAMVCAAGLAFWADVRYASVRGWVDLHGGAVLGLVGLVLPASIASALTLLNVVVLIAWLAIKLMLMRLIAVRPLGGLDALFEVAYRRRENVWRLKPWWLPCRAVPPALSALGLGLLAWQWTQLSDPAFVGWAPLLPAGLIAIGIEWWWWLSGEVSSEIEPEFAGGDVGSARPAAMFEDLWQRYRRVWPTQWRAAGNRAPEISDG